MTTLFDMARVVRTVNRAILRARNRWIVSAMGDDDFLQPGVIVVARVCPDVPLVEVAWFEDDRCHGKKIRIGLSTKCAHIAGGGPGLGLSGSRLAMNWAQWLIWDGFAHVAWLGRRWYFLDGEPLIRGLS